MTNNRKEGVIVIFSNHMDTIQLSRIRQIGEKAGEMAKAGRSVIKLQVGEPDFDTPQPIIDAAIASLNRRETHYAHNRGTIELRQALSEKLRRDNGIEADPVKNILTVCGCAEALLCAVVGLMDPGDEMIVIEPTFINYVQLTRMAGCTPVIIRADENNGWLPDPEEIEKAVTPHTRLLLLNTPCNPTGTVYPLEILQEIARIALKYNLIVISDEVYEKLIYGAVKHISIASLPGMAERTVTINGFSKAYAMTGWRLGYIAADEALILPMLKMHQYATTCLPVFVQAGALEALQNGADAVESMRKEYEHRRDVLAGMLRQIDGLKLDHVPDGTFYMYPNISAFGLKSEEFVMRLLDETGVATTFGTAFDQRGENNIRISFANSLENLIEGAKRIGKFTAGLR